MDQVGKGVLGLEILEEKVVEFISRVARLREENARLRGRVLELERTLAEREELLKALSHQRDSVQARIDNLIRRIEEYQEVLSQDAGLMEEDRG